MIAVNSPLIPPTCAPRAIPASGFSLIQWKGGAASGESESGRTTPDRVQ